MKTYPIDSYWVNFVYFVMFLHKINVHKDGNNHGYWALVESRRTARGPRQRVVAYLGAMDASGSLGVKMAAEGRHAFQQEFFRADEPEWIPVNIKAVHTGRVFNFGEVWLAYQLIKKLALDEFFSSGHTQETRCPALGRSGDDSPDRPVLRAKGRVAYCRTFLRS